MVQTVLDGPRQWLHEKPLYPKESESSGINFSKDFLDTDWGAAVGGLYTLTILASEHNMAGNVPVRVFDSSDRIIYLDYRTNDSGDIFLEVTEVPDYRFSGSIHMGV